MIATCCVSRWQLHIALFFLIRLIRLPNQTNRTPKVNDFDLKRKFNFYSVYFARIRFFSFRQLRLNDEW